MVSIYQHKCITVKKYLRDKNVFRAQKNLVVLSEIVYLFIYLFCQNCDRELDDMRIAVIYYSRVNKKGQSKLTWFVDYLKFFDPLSQIEESAPTYTLCNTCYVGLVPATYLSLSKYTIQRKLIKNLQGGVLYAKPCCIQL